MFIFCDYFDSELCWHKYCTMLNKVIMTLDCLVSKLEKSLNKNIYSLSVQIRATHAPLSL